LNRGAQLEEQLADQMIEATPRRRSQLGLDKHDLGEAREGLKFSVERDATDAIDAVIVSTPRQCGR
jgi:hypothetical protein